MKTILQSIRTKCSLRVKKVTRQRIYGALFLFGFLAPYIHIPFNIYDSPGILGFTWMSSFFFAIGFPVFIMALALMLQYASSYLPGQLKKVFRIMACLSFFTGFYFLFWALNPFLESDFHPIFYYGAMMLISMRVTKVLRYLTLHSMKDRKIIRWLMDKFMFDVKEYVSDNETYTDKFLNPTIDELHKKTR